MQASHVHESGEATEQDLYVRFKTLQRQLEFVEIQVSLLALEVVSSRKNCLTLSTESF